MSEELKPCPFCGGKATLEAVESPLLRTRWSVGCNDGQTDDGTPFEVLCYGYQSLTTFATKREAIAAWNRRTPATEAERG